MSEEETAPAAEPEVEGVSPDLATAREVLQQRRARKTREFGNESAEAAKGEADAVRPRHEQAEDVRQESDGSGREVGEAEPRKEAAGQQVSPASDDDEPTDEPTAKRLAVLARREKRLRDEEAKRQAELQSRERALQEREARAEAQSKTYAEIQRALVQDPANALQKIAEHYQVAPQLLSYEALTKRRLKGSDQPDPSEQLVGEYGIKVQEMERRLEELQKQNEHFQQQYQQQQVQAAEAQHRAKCADFFSGNATRYPSLERIGDAPQRIHQLVKAHYNKTHAQGNPVLLQPKQAADILERKYAALAQKLTGGAAGRTQSEEKPRTPRATGPKTIGNRQVSGPAEEWPSLDGVTDKRERLKIITQKAKAGAFKG